MPDRDLIAIHEAGHAVAAMMCDGGTFVSVSIEPACTVTRLSPEDRAFVIYAGPWAQARAEWTAPTLDGLDDADDEGLLFDDYVTTALVDSRDHDLALYTEALADDPDDPDEDRERAQTWTRELESVWPVMQQVAALLVDGQTVTAETVADLLDR
jgi:hypothetical protein